ncbi:MAG: bifunctional DNA-formamidopyrimidine glycosylase/DNA-(apurinic or apyrimidinic site) lyase [Burkholderiales bacterium]|uniref:bifunctional DNA-formamidopyrimidine glycosylase/DNA-(apurinic or apyrimidinic site) lyase n=1 Tax=Inhella sp. TaxID=1921806 RepID=UPI001AD13D48|nr:bifunctional DNA-formamidopyrimidine glycosylase/DNA-(apurinic or apyrimidinic site) lyase [Burkholderiales bacterium]
MPELPEVEITRQGFAQPLAGAQVKAVELGKPLRWPLGVEPASLVGAQLGLAERRGKYIWLPLADRGGLLLHLGMSGSLSLDQSRVPLGVHDHFALHTTGGSLRLHDPRRFGAVVWSPSLDENPARKLLVGLGAEPFDPQLSGDTLHAAWRGRRVAVKQALLAGDAVVGAGNIYACEALFLAGIHPALPAGRLSKARCTRLLAALRQVLGRALELGGSTLRDFRSAHGVNGNYQGEALVYGREGQACPQCGGAVRRIVQAQRSTYFCPACQKR